MAITDFADEVLADGPIGFWRLGEARGSVAVADASGNGNNGTCSGGVTLGQPGLRGGDTAALYDGSTGRIVVLNSNSLNPANLTIEAKVRWDGPNDLYQRIVEKSSFPELAQYGLGILPNGHVRVELRTSSAPASVDVDSTAVVAQGAESHIVATYDGTGIRTYLNGVLDSETRAPGSISPKPPTPLNLIESGVGIGNQTQRDRPFNGLIDEVALYPAALSPERVLAHYRSQFRRAVVFQYAAKVVCGESPGEALSPGVYFTAVNVHNPTYTAVTLRVKAAVALPHLRPGPVSPFQEAVLGPDEALEIDCAETFRLAQIDARFVKGFVVIESDTELDVVSVYTAGPADGPVATLHTERVPARTREAGIDEVCVDFEPPLNVGDQFGQPAGHSGGDVIFTTRGIEVSVQDFSLVGGGSTLNVAQVDQAPAPLGGGQAMRLNNISLGFNFTRAGLAGGVVSFDFLDMGGYHNLSVNGSPVFVGDIKAVPSPTGGVAIAVSTTPVVGGTRGVVVLRGTVEDLLVGGQELWIDNICVRT